MTPYPSVFIHNLSQEQSLDKAIDMLFLEINAQCIAGDWTWIEFFLEDLVPSDTRYDICIAVLAITYSCREHVKTGRDSFIDRMYWTFIDYEDIENCRVGRTIDRLRG